MNNNMNILKLPPEVIVEILTFCHPLDVIIFAKAVEEKKIDIWDLIGNGRLWKYVLIPPDEKIFKYLKRFGTKIKHLKICSLRKMRKITMSFMLKLRFTCTRLEKLTIANCAINSDEIKLKMFPKTISNLSFEDVYLPISNGHVFNSVYSSLFYRMQRSLPALKCLEVKGDTRYLSDLVAAAIEGLPYDNYRNRRDFTWPHIKFGENKYSIFKIENEVKGCLGEKEHRRLERYKIFKASIDLFKYITDNNFGHFLVDVKEVVDLGFN